MKHETIQQLTIPKIGFGTWKIGGNSHPDRSRDAHSIAALRTALRIGYTHFDTAEVYAGGHAEELLGRVIREMRVDRQSLFITTKVDPGHLRYEDVLKSCTNSLDRLRMEYVDLYLIHWPPRSGMRLEEAFRALNQLVRQGRVRHLGVSNFNVRLLQQAQQLSETMILTNQVPYSLADRSYVKNGVLDYCQQQGILLTAYSPVEQGRLRMNPALRSVAEAHGATPYQIALAWLAAQPRVITIPMSLDAQHIKENFEAGEINLTEAEIEQLELHR